MYSQVWKKYLPVIRILMKKALTAQQTLNLNRTDFERAGTGRKAGYKFRIAFTDGRVGNVISDSSLAVHLAETLLEDQASRGILETGDFELSLTTRFQLIISKLESDGPAE